MLGHCLPSSSPPQRSMWSPPRHWLHSMPFFMQGTKKEKPLLLPLLFCSQHRWLKAAEQVKFTVRCVEILVATWPQHWLHGPRAGHAKMAPSGCLLTPGRTTFFLLKYIITETLPTSLIGLAICHSSEPSGIGSVRHSRGFKQLLSQKLPLWLSLP